jgi:acyl-CoA dehydrogenase
VFAVSPSPAISSTAPAQEEPLTYDLTVSADLVDLADRVRAFIDEEVIPREGALAQATHGVDDDLRRELQSLARARGVFAPTAPEEFGGLGLDHRAQSIILEESGRSLIGPTAMNCAAPDEGNLLLLDKVATPAQRARYLAPLARGEMRSSFSMTEPSPGAGADPNQLATVAERSADGWVINGRKWFITGALGAGFSIVMARTDGGATMFLVDADNPGMRVDRVMDTLDRAFTGGHCEVVFDDCRVDDSAVLGSVDEGFRYAQVRLGPARLTHCMRWLGAARRAHEEAVRYASERPMFGSHEAQLGMAQQLIADNEIDIAAARGLIWQAAWALDQGRPARQETSVAKVFVAEAVNRISDRAMQLSGGRGVSSDSPIASIFTDIRPFRIYDGPSEVHRWSIARRSVRRHQGGTRPGDWRFAR